VLPLLATDFVVGWQDSEGEDHVGYSHGYAPRQSALGTTNGAGGHNVQIFVLSADRVVLHALPGFWHPDDLVRELRFAQVLARLWADDAKTTGDKWRIARRLQLRAAESVPADTEARSAWQPFDAFHEQGRVAEGARDTFVCGDDGTLQLDENGRPRLVSIPVLMHRRMADRPFVPFDAFDTAAFCDYGRYLYDLNEGRDGDGKTFIKLRRLAQQRARAAKRNGVAPRP
jgi:hypothetical protein